MPSAQLRRPLPIRRRLAPAVLAAFVLALATPAAALSRAMWAEFNAIYLINLKPAAECRMYRTRSIELLKDTSLSPVALDERMHALWNEAKANCLAQPAPEQPSARQQRPAPAAGEPRTMAAGVSTPAPVAAAASARPPEPTPPPVTTKPAPPAVPVPAAAPAPAPVPTPAPAPVSAPAHASAHAPVPAAASPAAAAPAPPAVAKGTPEPATPPAHEPATAAAGRGSAAPGMPMQSTPGTKPPGEGRPMIALPQLKPAIERPQTVDLRLEAACAKRNPYAYQVASDDDPCARLAKSKGAAAGPAEPEAAQLPGRTPAWVWAVAGVALAGLAGGGASLWRRRRRRTDATAPADDEAGEDERGRDRQEQHRSRPADGDDAPEHPHGEESLAPALP